MQSDRWKQIEGLFDAAQRQPADRRVEFLRQACPDDLQLRAEVLSLINNAEAGDSFLDGAPFSAAGERLVLKSGDQVGVFEIAELIGKGGMGEVYRARDSRLRRQVALKVLPAMFAGDADRLRRFLLEARAASQLNHPNILTVHDVGTHDGTPYIVSELLEGETIQSRLAAGRIPVQKALDYAIQTADGLAAAHQRGILHRDLKPANLFVTKDGRVKILDFGLAKLAEPYGSGSETFSQIAGTVPGIVLGTVGYMSPEQVRGQPADTRSDIFSFGVILYELLTGQRAFRGDSAAEAMSAVLKEEPPEVSKLNPELSPEISRVVQRCLDKTPQERFQSAADLAFTLRGCVPVSEVSAALPGTGTPAHVRRRRWLVPAFVTTSVLLAILSAGLYRMRPEPLDPSAYKFRPIATEAELESLGSWSPDGKSIAYLKAVQGKRQLMLRSLDATSPVQLTKLPNGVSQGAAPFFSPSGELVYFIARDGVWSVAVVGGEPRPVLKVPMFAAALSPDGQTLAFWRQHEEAGKEYCTVWISSPPGAPPRKYEPAPFQSTSCYIPNFLSYSPDGSQIALTTYTKVGEASVWILPWPDGTKARPRRAFSSYLFRSPSSLGWMPDSRSFCLVKDGNLWLGDPAAGKLQRLTVSPVGQFREPSVSPGGDALLFTAMLNDMDIVEIPLDGTSPRPLLATARNEAWPSMSAAGDQMAFVTDRTGEYEIWLRNPQAGWERPVVRQKDFPQDPGQLFVAASLSPDGARVAYLRHSKLWVSPVSGGRASQAVGGDESQDSAASWSPDSTSLTYIATSGGKLHLAVTRIGSQEPQFLVPGTANQCVSPPVWSPDGRWIACGSLEDQNRLLLFSPDGGQRRTVPSPAAVTPQRSVMVWSRDAQTIYLASSAELKARLDAIDIRTGTSRRIAEYAGEIVFGSRTAFTNTASLSRDGKSFVTTILHTREDLWVLEGFPQSRRRWF